MATKTVIATGNFSASGTWDAGVPGAGDDILQNSAFTLHIDQDVIGIKQWVVNHNSAVVDFDNTGTGHTVAFASTGANAEGGGTFTSPNFAAATMFGFFVARGTLRLEGDATHLHTITSANDASPIYLHHQHNDFGGSGQVGTLSMKYLTVRHAGMTAAQPWFGIRWFNSPTTALMSIDHCRFYDPQVVLNLQGSDPLIFEDNYIHGAKDNTLSLTAPGAAIIVRRNTEEMPAATGKFMLLANNANASASMVFEDNVLALTNNGMEKVLYKSSGSGFGLHQTIRRNYHIGPPNGQQGVGYYFWSADSALEASHNVGEHVQYLYNYFADIVGNVHHSFVRQYLNMSGIQGSLALCDGFAPGTVFHHNISDNRNDAGGTGNGLGLFWCNFGANFTGFTAAHNTFRMAGSGGTTYGILVGEGDGPMLQSIIRDNSISGSFFIGIGDNNAAGGHNTYVAEYNGAGVHHNNVYGVTNAYDDNGGTGFDDGATSHPHTLYGDVAVDPQFLDPDRTGLMWDVTLGGPGTYQGIVDQFANRCGCTGSTYDARYNVLDLYTYLAAGWVPQNPAMHAASDGGWMGAVEGVAAGPAVTPGGGLHNPILRFRGWARWT